MVSSACADRPRPQRAGRGLSLLIMRAPAAAEAAAKAQKMGRKVRRGTHNQPVQVRTSVRFRRPKTLKLARAPKYARRATPRLPRMHKFRVVQYPLTTESAMKKIEDNNTLVFIVDVKANKRQIRAAVKSLYDISCDRINTLIRCAHLRPRWPAPALLTPPPPGPTARRRPTCASSLTRTPSTSPTASASSKLAAPSWRARPAQRVAHFNKRHPTFLSCPPRRAAARARPADAGRRGALSRPPAPHRAAPPPLAPPPKG